jgi:CrcB protein
VTRFIMVCLGGAVGSGARYLIALWAPMPWATLIVNVAGSFLLAFLMESMPPSDVRVMLTVGVMGGFTTYSTFNYETTAYLRAGASGAAAMNIAVTLVGCLAAGVAGLAVARAMIAK